MNPHLKSCSTNFSTCHACLSNYLRVYFEIETTLVLIKFNESEIWLNVNKKISKLNYVRQSTHTCTFVLFFLQIISSLIKMHWISIFKINEVRRLWLNHDVVFLCIYRGHIVSLRLRQSDWGPLDTWAVSRLYVGQHCPQHCSGNGRCEEGICR